MILAKHLPGPIPQAYARSCVAPSGCDSPQGLTFEIRGDLSQPGRDLGAFIGRLKTNAVVADASASTAFACLQGDLIEIMHAEAPVRCCFGGQSGSSFSLSPTGDQLAYSPDGTRLQVAPLVQAGDSGRNRVAGPRPDHGDRLRLDVVGGGPRRFDLAGLTRRATAAAPGHPTTPRGDLARLDQGVLCP